jgi:hypothetical protein
VRVKELAEMLATLNPEEELCVLMWRKEMFDFEENDDLMLTETGWGKVVHDFEESPISSNIYDEIFHAVLDYADIRPFEEDES